MAGGDESSFLFSSFSSSSSSASSSSMQGGGRKRVRGSREVDNEIRGGRDGGVMRRRRVRGCIGGRGDGIVMEVDEEG